MWPRDLHKNSLPYCSLEKTNRLFFCKENGSERLSPTKTELVAQFGSLCQSNKFGAFPVLYGLHTRILIYESVIVQLLHLRRTISALSSMPSRPSLMLGQKGKIAPGNGLDFPSLASNSALWTVDRRKGFMKGGGAYWSQLLLIGRPDSPFPSSGWSLLNIYLLECQQFTYLCAILTVVGCLVRHIDRLKLEWRRGKVEGDGCW